MRGPRAYVVMTIIALNLAVFIMWTFSSQTPESFMAQNFLVSWDALIEGRYWTLLSSVFSHNMVFHIMINMFVLRSFGTFIEQILGPVMFLTFYLIAGVLSSLCHCLVSAFILHTPELAALGASGAIAGLVLLFALMFPREKILLLGFIPVPAIWGAFGFIGLDLWGLTAQVKGGGLPIGHGAHLGGSITGIFFFFIVVRPRMLKRQRQLHMQQM